MCRAWHFQSDITPFVANIQPTTTFMSVPFRILEVVANIVMAKVKNIHSLQAASGFRSHFALVICKQNPLLSLLAAHFPHRVELNLDLSDDWQFCYFNRCIGNMEFWFIWDGVLGSRMLCNQNHDKRTDINTVSCVVRDNHRVVIGCLVGKIALVCGCFELVAVN